LLAINIWICQSFKKPKSQAILRIAWRKRYVGDKSTENTGHN